MVTTFASKLVTAITFRKVLIWMFAGITLIISFTAYEQRSTLFEATALNRSVDGSIAGNPVGSTFTVSSDTKKGIQSFVKNEKSVIGFVVVSADIRLNARNILFFSTDPSATNQPSLAPLLALTRLPLFTKNDENNRQMIKLIKGEFVCGPYSTTILSSIAPSANKDVIAVCYASLPPYYGHYSGFVSILLNSDPDIDEQVRLKQAIEAMATEIYFRDVIPTSKRVKF